MQGERDGNELEKLRRLCDAAGISPDKLPQGVLHKAETLGHIAATLELQEASVDRITEAVMDLQGQTLDVTLALRRLRAVELELKAKLDDARGEEASAHAMAHELSSLGLGGSGDKVSLERRKKALVGKAKDYQARLEAVKPPRYSISVGDCIALQDELAAREGAIREKESRVRAFAGLPPNLTVARFEVEKGREKLMELVMLREKLLSKMAAGVS
ncbi:hypothetical protein BOTBODRAFT_155558 [Botryobasidium botryosum FD-172 SS1]|uniref:Uncharacterized protein n=1 Tax=Botryobasidium botryosum (strain FD-172 SS1) TaxID=930990 RepID=A0A067MS51_BOTB1|nr:hypothetical protein BOTBODRAFT_155558 [Botryobasidium botryosum FD-172 SS1]